MPAAAATSDTTGLLAALVAADCAVGDRHHRRSRGGCGRRTRPGRAGPHRSGPRRQVRDAGPGAVSGGSFTVEKLGDGAFTGNRTDVGVGVKVRLGPDGAPPHRPGAHRSSPRSGSRRADQSIFRQSRNRAGPARRRFSGSRARSITAADFQPIAAAILVVAAPGARSSPIRRSFPSSAWRPGHPPQIR